eukprot:CAMPEP_0179280570 /NCGR_PEP_ID=MMETSP0797-20121207/36698_1 /TAXON_ID=47934 /ORGANISM="Dinophysis acuminata, Strain DAEP01" /LENGTH=309 /DNA_ID=CAMNT_0020989235 /DNA_START=84 /DNA_END=1010 /DNA_ORIENTATION=-
MAPQVAAAVRAGRGHRGGASLAEQGLRHGAPVAHEGLQAAAGAHVPDLRRPVVGARHEEAAVGGEVHRVHRPRVPREHCCASTGLHAPDPDTAVGGPAREVAAVPGEGNRRHFRRVADQCSELPALLRLPDPCGVVVGGRRNLDPARGEHRCVDVRLVALQRHLVAAVAVARGANPRGVAVLRDRDNSQAVGRERGQGTAPLLGGDRCRALARVPVPGLQDPVGGGRYHGVRPAPDHVDDRLVEEARIGERRGRLHDPSAEKHPEDALAERGAHRLRHVSAEAVDGVPPEQAHEGQVLARGHEAALKLF